MKLKHLYLFSVLLFFFISCDKDGDKQDIMSKHEDIRSHNTGENCMNCHNAEGESDFVFTVAGSVYDTTQITPFPNANVILYADTNGTGSIVKNIEVDEFGNFFTTESISFENDLYVSVLNPNGTETFMNTSLLNGECNSCHGSSSVRIFVP